jgi:alkylated DNA repair dioxygenase AlkB
MRSQSRPESPDLAWQPSLLTGDEPAIDRSFASLQRVTLDETAWVDHAPGWVAGSDGVFRQLLDEAPWQHRVVPMYGSMVEEPRLTVWWQRDTGDPPVLPLVEDMRVALSVRYEVEFDSVGLNLYRDGRDSVAWHRDRIAKEVDDPLVAIASVGEPRRFLLRPYRGGSSRVFLLGRGDLLVTGGTTQRTWQHTVPKVARAGPRISITFRHSRRSQ